MKNLREMRNKLSLIGTVHKKFELKNFDNNVVRIFFTLKIDESYKNNQGEKVSNNTYVGLTAWNGTARIVDRYLEIGREVAIEARLENFINDNDSNEQKFGYNFNVSEIIFLKNNRLKLSKTKENM